MTLCRRGRGVFAKTLVRGLVTTLPATLLIGISLRQFHLAAPRMRLKDSALLLSPGHKAPWELHRNSAAGPDRANLPGQAAAHSTSCRRRRRVAIPIGTGDRGTARPRMS